MKIRKLIPSKYLSWTPTFAGLDTCTGISIFYKINGTTISGYGKFTTGPTPTAVTATMSLPTGMTLGGASGERMQCGFVNRNASVQVQLMGVQGQSYFRFGSGAAQQGDVQGASLFGGNETLYFKFVDVPIVELGG